MKVDGVGPLVGFVYDYQGNECAITVEMPYRMLNSTRYLNNATIVFGNLTQEERRTFVLDKLIRVTVEVLDDEDDNREN